MFNQPDFLTIRQLDLENKLILGFEVQWYENVP